MGVADVAGLRKSEGVATLFIYALAAFMVGLALAQPYMEARTFNRCTGSNVTYWDAAFADLRVLECK